MNNVLFVLGGPGSGKGTQCELLSKKFNFYHISVGDLLRREIDRKTKFSNLINETIKHGKILSTDITINIIKSEIESINNGHILIDGYPRNMENMIKWYEIMNESTETKGILYYNASEDIMVKRITDRSKKSGRIDDNMESIKKRLRNYELSTIPVIEHFAKNELVYEINANQSIDKVFNMSINGVHKLEFV